MAGEGAGEGAGAVVQAAVEPVAEAEAGEVVPVVPAEEVAEAGAGEPVAVEPVAVVPAAAQKPAEEVEVEVEEAEAGAEAQVAAGQGDQEAAAPQAAYNLDKRLQFKIQNGRQISLEIILNMLKNPKKCKLTQQECENAFTEIKNAKSEQDVKNIIGKLKIFNDSIQSGGTRKPRMHRRKKTQRKRSKTIKKKTKSGNRK